VWEEEDKAKKVEEDEREKDTGQGEHDESDEEEDSEMKRAQETTTRWEGEEKKTDEERGGGGWYARPLRGLRGSGGHGSPRGRNKHTCCAEHVCSSLLCRHACWEWVTWCVGGERVGACEMDI
jgi:hypothetical protein